MNQPSREMEKALIRFPHGLKPKLQELAQANYRSMNAEIVARLQRDIDREEKGG